MTNMFWKRASYIAGLLSIAVLFGLVVFAANVEIKDFDLWLHLKMGEYITMHKSVPDVDVLSHTIAGKPWVNHEWLFQVIVYNIYNAWGAEGLISMQAFVVIVTFLILLFLGYNKEKQFGVVFILLFVMLVYQLRFTIRPDIFSLLFFACYIYILALHLDKRWSLYALFIIQALWANFHGFFFFGPFIVLVGIASEYIKRHVKLPWEWNQAGRLEDIEFKRLKQVFIFVILASLFNPLTFRGAWYPVDVLINLPGKSRIFFSHIQELKPPFSGDSLFSIEPYSHYKILILLSFFSFVFNRRRIDIGDLFIWLIFLSISLAAIRNLVFFAFVAYLVCMTNFGNLAFKDLVPITFRDKKFLDITVCLLKVCLIVWMLQYGSAISMSGYFDFDKFELKSEFGGITQRNYPNKAADFLIANRIKGNFFNDFNSGAYLIGRCYPDIKVFIDGRTEVYGPEFFSYYEKIWGKADTGTFDDAVKKYNITGVLLNTVHESAPEKILQHLYQSKDWALVYLDYDAVIFLKNIPEHKSVIQQFRIDLENWKTMPMDLKRLGPRLVPPFQYINRAYTLESLGFNDAALEEAKEAVKISPHYAGAYKIMGKIYGDKNEYEKAFENFRIAAMLLSGDVEIRYNLALAYYKLSDFEHAIGQYNAILRARPKEPRAYYLLAKVYAEDKQFENAMGALNQATRLDVNATATILEIGDILFKKDRFEFALKAYRMALLANKDLGKVHNKIGLCLRAMGLKKEAKEEFEKGLQLEKDNKELEENIRGLEGN